MHKCTIELIFTSHLFYLGCLLRKPFFLKAVFKGLLHCPGLVGPPSPSHFPATVHEKSTSNSSRGGCFPRVRQSSSREREGGLEFLQFLCASGPTGHFGPSKTLSCGIVTKTVGLLLPSVTHCRCPTRQRFQS